MPLSLGVHMGMKINVGPHQILVEDIMRGTAIKVSGKDGQEFLITDQQRTEVYPEVFLSYGSPGPRLDYRGTRLAIEAPRELNISREDPLPA